MVAKSYQFKLHSEGHQATFHTITGQVKGFIKESGVLCGICVIFSRHTTCSVITDEDTLDMSMTGLKTLQQDFMDVFQRMIPNCDREGQYLHPGPKALAFAATHGEDARGCHNTEAHLRSSIVGRSVTIPIINGVAELGDFGEVFFVDFDRTRPRDRTVTVQILGE